MKVALFTDTYLPEVNGVARTLGRWVEFLSSKNIACKVFAPTPDKDSPMGNDQNIVERFHSIPFLLYPECRLGIPNPIQIKKTLKKLNPDLIHVATPFNMGLYGQRYARKHGVPLVASYHTNFDQYLSYYKINWVELIYWKYMNWFHQYCEKVFVPSNSTLNYLADHGFKNLEVWGRGIDLTQFSPDANREEVWNKHGVDPSKFIVLYVGRLAPEKGMDVLFAAFDQLPDYVKSNAHLVLAGDGPLSKELHEQYGDRPDITFLGFVKGKSLSELYAAADVFLFPSATETFGNVVLESMASCTPVIGARAGGVMDNVTDQVNGLLCMPERSEEFANAVVYLHDHPEVRKEMGTAARAYSEQQTWDRIFNDLLASYEEVVAKHQVMISTVS